MGKTTDLFGLYLSTQFPTGDDIGRRIDEARQQVIQAEVSGFASVWAGSHYLTYPMVSVQPVPLLARLIPDAGNMILGTNILVLPLLSPVAVAEESASLSLLSNGRYILGVGLGYRDAEFDAFDVPKRERVARLEESVEIIRSLLAHDSVTFTGSHCRLDSVGLGAKSDVSARLPIYMGGTADLSISRAGRLADGVLMDIYLTLSRLQEQANLFRSSAQDASRPAGEIVVIRECYIGKTRASALRDCQKAIETKYAAYASWGQDSFLGAEDKFDQPLESFVEDRLLIGDLAYVRDEIARYSATLGARHFVFRVHWPTLPIDHALSTIRQLGTILSD